MLRGLVGSAIASSVLLVSLPVSAQTCNALKAVGSANTQIEKKVSVPGAGPISRNNWNTDFSIPGNRAYSYFVGTIIPRNSGQYAVQMSLKYSNDTADKVFDQSVELKQGVPYRITGATRVSGKPYQVNLSIGGVPAVGNTYMVSASACR